jgi:hypothetical protein
MWLKPINFLAIPLISILLFFVSCDRGSNAAQNAVVSDPTAAIEQGKLDVAWSGLMGHIKTPSTAKMQSYNKYDVEDRDATIYDFIFDAQNDFGAMLRARGQVLVYREINSNRFVSNEQFVTINDPGSSSEQETSLRFTLSVWKNDSMGVFTWKNLAKTRNQ